VYIYGNLLGIFCLPFGHRKNNAKKIGKDEEQKDNMSKRSIFGTG
jgi:hypothetical protein